MMTMAMMMIRHRSATFATLKNRQARIQQFLINSKPKPSYSCSSFHHLRCLSSSPFFIGSRRNISTRTRRRSNDSRNSMPLEEPVLLDGCDFHHWLVVVETPDPHLTRDEIIDAYVETLAQCLGSEEEARKSIYSVSTKHYFAFSCVVSEHLSNKIKELPKVRWVLPDSYLDVPNKTYGGEPFINGKAVPYDPKYHERWVRNTIRSKNNYLKYRDRKSNDGDGFSARMVDRMMTNKMPPSSSSHNSTPSRYPPMSNVHGPASMASSRVRSPDYQRRDNLPQVHDGFVPYKSIQTQIQFTPPTAQIAEVQSNDGSPMRNMEPVGQYYPPFPPAQPQNWISPGIGFQPGFQNQNSHSNNFPSNQNKTFENRENLQVQSFGSSAGSNMYLAQNEGFQNGNYLTPVQNPGFHNGNNMPSYGSQNTRQSNCHMPHFVPNHEFHGNGMPPHVENQQLHFRQAENLRPGFQLIPRFVHNHEFHGNGMPFHVENQEPQLRQAENLQPGFQLMPRSIPNHEFYGNCVHLHVENLQPQFRQAENLQPRFQLMPPSVPNLEFHSNGLPSLVKNQQPQFRQAENFQPGFQQVPRSVPNHEYHSNGMPSLVENQQPQFRHAENLRPGFQLRPHYVPNHEFYGNGIPSPVENQQRQFRQAENFHEFRLIPHFVPNHEFHGNGMPFHVENQQPQFTHAENSQPRFQLMPPVANHEFYGNGMPSYAQNQQRQFRQAENLQPKFQLMPLFVPNYEFRGNGMLSYVENQHPQFRQIENLQPGFQQNWDVNRGNLPNNQNREAPGFTKSANMQDRDNQGQNIPGFTNSIDTDNREYQGQNMRYSHYQ